jgi:transcriptional regulator with GAF, ATPase, and Fis domain
MDLKDNLLDSVTELMVSQYSGTEGINRMIDSFLCMCLKVTHSDDGRIFFKDPEATSTKGVQFIVADTERIRRESFVGACPWCSALAGAGPTSDLLISHPTTDHGCFRMSHGQNPWLIVPILYQARPVGAVAVATSGSKSDIDGYRRALEVIAQELAYQIKRYEVSHLIRMKLARDVALIGMSQRMRAIDRFVERAAQVDLPVLITGESGTGKELVAHAIHYASDRCRGPLVTINCAAVNSELAESEFFGHLKGAFTGAYSSRSGIFETAHQGTAILDEIGELPYLLQAKLLRVLQFGEVQKVGSDRIGKSVDVRIVAATNADLETLVKRQRLSEALLYRLDYLCIDVPPLRERKEDLPHLVAYFLMKYGPEQQRISEEVLALFHRYHWPGNVRQLEATVARLATLSNKDTIDMDEIACYAPKILSAEGAQVDGKRCIPIPANLDSLPLRRRSRAILQSYEKQEITKSLKRHWWNISKAAEELGMKQQYLSKLMKQYGITKP